MTNPRVCPRCGKPMTSAGFHVELKDLQGCNRMHAPATSPELWTTNPVPADTRILSHAEAIEEDRKKHVLTSPGGEPASQSPEYQDAAHILSALGNMTYDHNKTLVLMNWKATDNADLRRQLVERPADWEQNARITELTEDNVRLRAKLAEAREALQEIASNPAKATTGDGHANCIAIAEAALRRIEGK